MKDLIKRFGKSVLDERALYSKFIKFPLYLLIISVVAIVFMELFTSIKIHDQLTVIWLVGLVILITISQLIVRKREKNLTRRNLVVDSLLIVILILLTTIFFF